MTLNDRDRRIIEFIALCPTNSFIVKELFFPSLQTAQRRLNKMYEEKLIKRYRSHVSDNYIYYLGKKPKQIEHTLYVSRLYVYWVKLGYEIIRFNCTPVLGNIIPDAIAAIKVNNEVKSYLVEVEISTNPISKKIKGYDEFFLKDCMDVLGFKPNVLFITNKKIPHTDFKHEVLRLNQL